MFNNFRDFATKDENLEVAGNLYENSRVRRLDYNQPKGTADQISLLD
jgi:hypothetical protein